MTPTLGRLTGNASALEPLLIELDDEADDDEEDNGDVGDDRIGFCEVRSFTDAEGLTLLLFLTTGFQNGSCSSERRLACWRHDDLLCG
jgi:hypothetical protein